MVSSGIQNCTEGSKYFRMIFAKPSRIWTLSFQFDSKQMSTHKFYHRFRQLYYHKILQQIITTKHFFIEKPAKKEDDLDIDWIPNRNLGRFSKNWKLIENCLKITRSNVTVIYDKNLQINGFLAIFSEFSCMKSYKKSLKIIRNLSFLRYLSRQTKKISRRTFFFSKLIQNYRSSSSLRKYKNRNKKYKLRKKNRHDFPFCI